MTRHRNKKQLQFRIQQGQFPTLLPGELLVEQISGEQLFATRDRAKKIREYQARAFYELEAQRAACHEAITAALQSISGTVLEVDGWCRSLKHRYAHMPLSCIGSLKQSGRFNYGADIDDQARFTAFPTLYIAADRATALCEMFGFTEDEKTTGLSSEALALQKEVSITQLALTGVVNSVFDLRNKANLKPFLDVTRSFKMTRSFRQYERQLGLKPMQILNTTTLMMNTFLERAWRAFPMHVDIPANSQIFGRLVSMAGFEGICYRSTRTGGDVLAIFPRNFRNSSSIVRVSDPTPEMKCDILTGETWEECERIDWQ